MFTAIVAYDNKLGIGKKGSIPWKISNDMKHFKNITQDNVVIMGRKTYESIGKPLPKRINLVISRTLDKNSVAEYKDLEVFSNPIDCVRYCFNIKATVNKKFFVIGGSEIYNWFYEQTLIKDAYITSINECYDCDVCFNINFKNVSIESSEFVFISNLRDFTFDRAIEA